MSEEKKDGKAYDRGYLHEMYNATSTDDGKGDIESYEFWLEKQLLCRLDVIDDLRENNKNLNNQIKNLECAMQLDGHSETYIRKVQDNDVEIQKEVCEHIYLEENKRMREELNSAIELLNSVDSKDYEIDGLIGARVSGFLAKHKDK